VLISLTYQKAERAYLNEAFNVLNSREVKELVAKDENKAAWFNLYLGIVHQNLAYLFSSTKGADWDEELDRGDRVSSSMLARFQDRDVFLDSKALIEVNQPGSRWMIVDTDGTRYRILAEDSRFNVYSLKEIDEAIKAYGQSIIYKKDLVYAYIKRAKIYHQHGDYDFALFDYKDALGLAPNNAEIILSLGKLYADTGKIEDAVSLYKSLLMKEMVSQHYKDEASKRLNSLTSLEP